MRSENGTASGAAQASSGPLSSSADARSTNKGIPALLTLMRQSRAAQKSATPLLIMSPKMRVSSSRAAATLGSSISYFFGPRPSSIVMQNVSIPPECGASGFVSRWVGTAPGRSVAFWRRSGMACQNRPSSRWSPLMRSTSFHKPSAGARVLLMLNITAASYINGVELPVDGGFIASRLGGYRKSGGNSRNSTMRPSWASSESRLSRHGAKPCWRSLIVLSRTGLTLSAMRGASSRSR